jgi:S-adenosylmethionine:tRNA ribosyltransferase-isomerase
MNLSEFDYRLPDELIAQKPLEDRAASRMLVVHRSTGRLEDRVFRELPQYLRPGDCLVINDTRVVPSRLYGRKEGYAREVEIFLLTPQDPGRTLWTALVRPGRHLHESARVRISDRLSVEILETRVRGERLVRVECEGDLDEEMERIGHVPLPPYIHRPDEAADRERYQTVFATRRGSAAAPTAGLHFTPEILDACRAAGAEIAPVTLHVGLGTFQPLLNETVAENRLHTERFMIPEESARKLAAAARRVAVGTTVVRTLESAARAGGLRACEGETDLFIYPGYRFQAVDAMLTNFHLPRSSLLLLVCAFGGKELILEAYRHAVEQRYRFFSYGDCMLIL